MKSVNCLIVVLGVLLMLLALIVLLIWQDVDRRIREIQEYLNARDAIPFFEGVFDNEKDNDRSLSDIIDRLRDAFPGKGGRDQS